LISFLRGKLAVSQPTSIIIDCQWGGFEVSIPLSTFEKLPQVGQEIMIHIHFHVREDAISLFGFMTEDEKKLFRMLIGVSKIGPKVALGILSGISVGELKSALVSGDVKRISLIPGVGKKTAERLVLELKEKVPAIEQVTAEMKVDGNQKEMIADTINALVSLGYNQGKAYQAVRETIKNSKLESLTIENLLKLALKIINK